MSSRTARNRFLAGMAFVLALAALLWAGLRLYNTAQDHDLPAPPPAAGAR